MMLDYLGERSGSQACADAAAEIESAVDRVFVEKQVRSYDIGGRSGTADITKAVIASLGKK
jgi:3-isopropylmalate dehydrogenase